MSTWSATSGHISDRYMVFRACACVCARVVAREGLGLMQRVCAHGCGQVGACKSVLMYSHDVLRCERACTCAIHCDCECGVRVPVTVSDGKKRCECEFEVSASVSSSVCV